MQPVGLLPFAGQVPQHPRLLRVLLPKGLQVGGSKELRDKYSSTIRFPSRMSQSGGGGQRRCVDVNECVEEVR